MDVREHSTIREGLVAGVIGAVVMAAWYFLFDAAAGRPFYTPNVLGKMVFRTDLTPGLREVVPGIVAAYTLLHLLMFVIVGVLLTLLTHMSTRDLSLRMGVWIGVVVAFCFFAGVVYALSTASGERLPLWEVIGGSLLAVAAMSWYLIRGHPPLTDTGRPLGDEVGAPPHPDNRRV